MIMVESKRMQIALIAVFLSLICLPYPLSGLVGRVPDSEVEKIENRRLAKKPELSMDSLLDFPDEYTAYFNDHIPFRLPLVQTCSEIEYYLFRTPINNHVIAGKDGWLFYSNREDGDPIGCYKGTLLFSQEELEKIASNLMHSKKKLKSKGIEFVLFIPPNKERVYPDKMPDYFGEPAVQNRVAQLVEYLRDNTDLTVVYPFDKLKEARSETPQYDIYWQTDTHWNELGAYIGACELLKPLGISLPDYREPSVEIVSSEKTVPGDLESYLFLGGKMNSGVDYTIAGLDGKNYVKDEWQFEQIYRAHSPEGDARKLFILRDSFCDSMADTIAPQFADSVMVYHHYYKNEMVMKERPDIFVYEVAERYLQELLDFEYR